MYVLSKADDGENEIIAKEITYTAGLYKIFHEILVNAADNTKQRDPNMDKLEITIKAEESLISVKNITFFEFSRRQSTSMENTHAMEDTSHTSLSKKIDHL